MRYGTKPEDLGFVDVNCEEMMFVQYMPICIEADATSFFVNKIGMPESLNVFRPLVEKVIDDLIQIDSEYNYIYITAKHLYVSPTYQGNRPGWHSDGFMSDDINYIWCSAYSTEFCVQDFNLTQDHEISMIEMEQQVNKSNIFTFPEKHLLKLTQAQIHRVTEIKECGMRTFVKVSASNDKYNLIGNAHNYLLDYKWDMQPRLNTRNHPAK